MPIKRYMRAVILLVGLIFAAKGLVVGGPIIVCFGSDMSYLVLIKLILHYHTIMCKYSTIACNEPYLYLFVVIWVLFSSI